MSFLAASLTEVSGPATYVVGLVGLAFGLLLVRDRVRRRRTTTGEMAAYSKRFLERLAKPDFAALEKHFGHVFPPALKAFYADTAAVSAGEFELLATSANGEIDRWHVAFFQPADLEHVADTWPAASEVFEFANDGGGNGYTIDPRADDPPVMFYDHETGEWQHVAPNFAGFLALPRREPGA